MTTYSAFLSATNLAKEAAEKSSDLSAMMGEFLLVQIRGLTATRRGESWPGFIGTSQLIRLVWL